MKHKMAFACVSVLGLLIAAAPASAMVKVAIYKGRIASGIDVTGEFGAANADLTGLVYAARYVYDTGVNAFHLTDSSTYDQLKGGDAFGNQSPLIDATLTISGITLHFNSQNYYSNIYTSSESVGDVAEDYTNTPIRGFYLSNQIYSTGLPTNLAGNTGPSVGSAHTGSFRIAQFDQLGQPATRFAYGSLGTNDTITVFSVRDLVSEPSTVPESATWVLMLGGCGIAGTALRRRRAALVLAR